MSHQDSKVSLKADCLRTAMAWLFGSLNFRGIEFRNECTWTPRQLAAAALVWAWSDELTLHDRFHTASKIIQFLFSPQGKFGGSYQGFIKLLGRWTAALVAQFQQHLRARMQTALAENWLLHGFAVFGVDGSRFLLPRTRSHEQAYGGKKKRKARRGKKSRSPRKNQGSGPQMWITTLWQMGTGLPWDWRLGPADSSERAHWIQMLPSLAPNALIAADAGFVGYKYATTVCDSGHHLLLRVGANVRLLRELGYVRERAGLVYLWPDQAAKKRQPPLVLRLVVAHNGKHPVYLVTSVLDPHTLSDAQLVEIYARRWGIELFYRHLKQTYDRRKLRSTSADNARTELEWSLVGLWAMGLYAQVVLAKHGVPPRKISVARVLRAFRRTLRDYRHPRERGSTMRDLISAAIIDSYSRRNKASRNYPRKKQETPPGPPKIILASPAQIALARQIARNCPQGLPA